MRCGRWQSFAGRTCPGYPAQQRHRRAPGVLVHSTDDDVHSRVGSERKLQKRLLRRRLRLVPSSKLGIGVQSWRARSVGQRVRRRPYALLAISGGPAATLTTKTHVRTRVWGAGAQTIPREAAVGNDGDMHARRPVMSRSAATPNRWMGLPSMIQRPNTRTWASWRQRASWRHCRTSGVSQTSAQGLVLEHCCCMHLVLFRAYSCTLACRFL